MKPTFHSIEKPNRRDSFDQVPRPASALPQTDCNFQAASLPHHGGSCLGSRRPSFYAISQSYFGQEARSSFAAEAAFFSVIVVTAAVPIIYSAIALLHLVRSISAL